MHWLWVIIIGFLAGAAAKFFVGGPGGFIVTTLLGTRDVGTLAPAALIVVAIVGRSRLRKRAREAAVNEWRRVRDTPASPVAGLEHPAQGRERRS